MAESSAGFPPPSVGLHTLDQTVPLPKTPSPVKRVLINYNYEVLCAYN